MPNLFTAVALDIKCEAIKLFVARGLDCDHFK
jgi:hypothetical protein